MTKVEHDLLIAIAREIAHLPPGGRVALLTKVFAVEEEDKRQLLNAEAARRRHTGGA